MKKFLLLVLVSLPIFKSLSQTSLVITSLEEKDQKLYIKYDILNYKQEDLFNVYVELTKSDGKIVRPVHVKGDIYKKRPGLKGGEIIWDLAADDIFINEDVDIQIGADVSVDISYFKYSNLMLTSTLLPGSGLSKIEKKKPYLLMSVLGYGALGTSAYFYTQALSKQTSYEDERDPVKRNKFKDEVNDNLLNAQIAGISAAGVWLINYGLFNAKWFKKKKEKENMNSQKLSFYTNYNPWLKGSVFTLKYQF